MKILNVTGFKIFSAVLAGVLLLESGAFAQDEQKNEPKIYRSKQMGDAAFNDAAFVQAAEFYRKFKDEAASDNTALREAYELLISSYIKADELEKAEKELTAYSNAFKDSGKTKIRLFKAEILLASNKPGEAEKIFSEIAESESTDSSLRINAVFGLGLSYIKTKNWDDAEKNFSKVQSLCAGKNPIMENAALREKIYVMIMSGKFQDALSQISEFQNKNGSSESSDAKVLKILLLVREDKLAEAKNIYDELVKGMEETPNPLIYITDTLMAKSYLLKNNPSEAIAYLKDSMKFAPGPSLKQEVLKAIIATEISADKKDDAIDAVNLYISYFPEADDSADMRVLLAKLFYEKGRMKEALSTLADITSNKTLPLRSRVDAAKQAASIFIEDKKFDQARAQLVFISKNSSDEYTKGEGHFLEAKLLFNEGKFKEASDGMLTIADKNAVWREKALYWAMRSYFEDKNYQKASLICEKLLKDKNTSTEMKQESSYFHGLIICKLGKIEEAVKELSSFTKNNQTSPFAPLALFECGRITFDKKDFASSVKYFNEFTSAYPNNPLAANAVYKRLFAYYFQNNDELAEKDVDFLAGHYPKSQFTISAMFWLSDYYRDRRLYDKADKLLGEIISRYRDDEETVAQALLDRAYICYRMGAFDRASSSLDELYEKYPDNKVVSEGYFLSGNILSDNGDMNGAISYYKKSAERKPDSILEAAALGRIGDCCFAAFSKNQDKKNLEEAVNYYSAVLRKKNISPDFAYQTIYKRGKSYELMGNDDKALENYNELIYGYIVDDDNSKPVWNVKAAQAAISIYLRKNSQDAGRNALNIYKKLIDMRLNLGEDYIKIIEDLKKKYKI